MKTLRLVSALLLLCAPAFAGSPEWLREAARAPLPAYKEDVRAVQLYAEQITRVTETGEIRTTYRKAFKILRSQGRDVGTLVVHFDKETKLSSLMGWTIPAKGSEYELKEKDAIETMLFNEPFYEDTRYKVLKLPETEPGSVVGFEYEQRQRPFALEDVWSFQRDIPTRKARYTLALPAGWEMKAHWRNHQEVPASGTGGTYTWEVSDIAEIKEEPAMPTFRAVAARLSVVLIPPSAGRGMSHASWSDVGKWYAGLTADRRSATPEIQKKVAELVRGAATPLDKIRALAAFAQRDVRYVAIEIGIGGYQPNYAASIFANKYGDCKDKVTLLSTMLREIGMESYYVVVHTERGFVARDFASMRNFNHVILGIRVPEGLDVKGLHSVVQHPSLGQLLMFDPTDSRTPVGYLPPSLQSNHGLLVTAGGGEMIDLPLQQPTANQLQRIGDLKLASDGTLSGEVREVRTGASAVEYRAELIAMEKQQRVQKMESFLSTFLTGFTLNDFQVENLEDYDKELVVKYSFVAKGYAKNAGALTLIRPRVFGSKSRGVFDLKERRYAVELDAPALHTDEFRITLPEGMVADELPPPVTATSGAVSYTSASTFENKVLSYKRTFKIEQVHLPLPSLEEWNKVNRRIVADERSSAVLKRMP